MSDTYCGRSCENCTYQEKLNCPGCKDGPGKKLYGECEISKCCFQKSQADCGNCTRNHSCGMLRWKDDIPKKRIARQEYEQDLFEKNQRMAKPLGKWLWILFWLVVPSNLASLMSHDTVAQWMPELYTPGVILQVLCGIAYGVILLVIAFSSDRYRIAGWCHIVATATGAIGFSAFAGWGILFTVISVAASLVGIYQEYYGHAEVLEYPDREQAEKWRKLFWWHIGVPAAMLGSLFLSWIPILMMLVLLAGVVGMLVIGIMQLVYLYRTAMTFRNFPDEPSL